MRGQKLPNDEIEARRGFEAIKAVYCYFFPETRDVMRSVELPDELFCVTTSVAEAQQSIDAIIQPQLIIPGTASGAVDLDEVHVPVISRILSAYKDHIPALPDFGYAYPTSGSSEGLFHLLTKLRTEGVDAINVLNGEYEGYAAQAANLGLQVKIHNLRDLEPDRIPPGYWFISNPSARDGNILPNETINKLCAEGHKIVLDLAYVGATRPHSFDVSHENIRAVAMSFSKPYGVFRFRAGGFCFSRDETPTLYGNKWFKDVPRLFQALLLAEKIGPQGLYDKYRSRQQEIVARINAEFGLELQPSDALLLAHLTASEADELSADQKALIEPYARGDGYRFCLTPYFEREELRRHG